MEQGLLTPTEHLNMPASSVHEAYISQLKHYSKAPLLAQKLLTQGYVAPKLKSSLQQF
jgi:hypothetical protein